MEGERFHSASLVCSSDYHIPALARNTRPHGAVPGYAKMIASRFYQLKSGRRLTGQNLKWTGNRVHTRHTRGRMSSTTTPTVRAKVRNETGPVQHLGPPRCSQAVLHFLSTTDVRWLVPGEDAQSEGRAGRQRLRNACGSSSHGLGGRGYGGGFFVSSFVFAL